MSLNIGVLGQVLFSPKKAFEGIKDSTTMVDGIIMLVILSVLGSIIGMVITMAVSGAIITTQGAALSMGNWVLSMVLDLVVGIIVLVAVGWLASVLAKSIGKGTGDMGKTVGLLGYSEIINLIMGILASIIIVAMAGSMVNAAISGNAGAALGFVGVIGILGIIGFIWMLYVGGSAVAVANNTSLGAGIASYFIASLIIGLIVVGVVFAAVFTMVGMAGPRMMGI